MKSATLPPDTASRTGLNQKLWTRHGHTLFPRNRHSRPASCRDSDWCCGSYPNNGLQSRCCCCNSLSRFSSRSTYGFASIPYKHTCTGKGACKIAPSGDSEHSVPAKVSASADPSTEKSAAIAAHDPFFHWHRARRIQQPATRVLRKILTVVAAKLTHVPASAK